MDNALQHEAVDCAHDGQRIAIVADSLAAANQVFNGIVNDSLSDVHSVCRANGRQAIVFNSGGRLSFLSVRSSGGRGMTLDRVYVPASIGGKAMADIAPSVDSTGGPIVGYF